MKRSYTIYSTLLQKACKHRGLKPLEAFDVLTRELSLSHSPLVTDDNNSPITAQSAIGQLELEASVLIGDCTHLFLGGREFCDWLVSCVPQFESEHARLLQEWLGVVNSGVLHFPTGQGLVSCVFYMPEFVGKSEKDMLAIAWDVGSAGNLGYACCALTDRSDVASELQKKKPEWAYYFRLVIGLGMYVACFPETLLDGPPQDLKHPSMHAYPITKTIGVSEKVFCSGTHESPIAHFRKGHFRVLRSEKFTHKRFQAVFVRETFVNGKAKTILAPEEVSA